jgi:DNA-binding response OmpR family regulator
MRILYVEDNKGIALAMRRFLQSQGHEVTLAYTARDAIAACVEKGFDLWILDVELPDGHGGTLLQTLRRMDDTKAIAITGHGMPHEIEEGQDDGFDAYLVKPVSVEQVLEVVRV